ncbi:MAG: mannitol dehydrogenase family protein, partial [Tyzzerella sp.]|nr:mannitol dehydrogenase family protein [Tyzzerella sp.]
IAMEGFDYKIIEEAYRPYDDFSILVTLKADGNIEKTVVGSVVESCILDSEREDEYSRAKEIFCKDSLQMASFTITEKGYMLTNGKGETLPAVEKDLKAGPEKPASYLGKVASLLYARYLAGKTPIAMVSMDNCSHNGERLYKAIYTIVKTWEENGVVEKGFLAYVDDETKVSFPWSMIDKITPRPDVEILQMLQKDGIDGLGNTATENNVFVAPFTNAEECQYLVIEDSFPNGRPALEKGGIIFTDRETVDKVERMKVCTCLNPLHTAMAIFGCVLGHTKISDEMKDEPINKLVRGIGYKEGLPVVVDPKVLDLKEFIDTVINERLTNPFIPDTPQRIARDTSQKLSIRFGETVKAYIASETLNVSDLKLIPLVFAGWMRYLMGIDDNGNKFELNPDILLETVCPVVAGIKLGDKINVEEVLRPLLTNKAIWGVDLYEIGMVELVCQYFAEMIEGEGAVRKTLMKYV